MTLLMGRGCDAPFLLVGAVMGVVGASMKKHGTTGAGMCSVLKQLMKY